MQNHYKLQNKYCNNFQYRFECNSLCMFLYNFPCNTENRILYKYLHILQYSLRYNHLVDLLLFGQQDYLISIKQEVL